MAKAIILLSDGTGNSSAKLFKTNVWRLYQALDLEAPSTGGMQQIAFYSDGVGTSSFKPLALLGGIFGVGLKRNVVSLYASLCETYQPGDTIYAFGFSRGAFTIRLLVGMIAGEGIVGAGSRADAQRYAPDAYRAFRGKFGKKQWIVNLLRAGRDLYLNTLRRMRKRVLYAAMPKYYPNIEFVGVWDTVAAYGMPISELTRGVDKWIWPLSMPNYVLSPKVKIARHALALDDERDTFHPLLWDEVNSATPGRIQQVWFAGMHTDVGGGYPDSSLAHVSLDWMVTEAQAGPNGLRFKPSALADIQDEKNELGAMHDSRAGFASYYRPQPRKISSRIDEPGRYPDPTTLIMQNPDLNGRGLLTEVKIHESVVNRIRATNGDYAPIVLPEDYTVIGATAPIPQPIPNDATRAARQEEVWDFVWHRRANYFLTLFFSVLLAAMPFLDRCWPSSGCEGPLCILSPAIASVGVVLPSFLETWTEAFAHWPSMFVALMIVIAMLMRRARTLRHMSHDRMSALWKGALTGTFPPPQASKIHPLRTSPSYQRTLRFLKWKLFPHVLGFVAWIVIWLTIAQFSLFVAMRVNVVWTEYLGDLCSIGSPARATPRVEEAALFRTSYVCWPIALPTLTEEQIGKKDTHTYRIEIDVIEPWVDETIMTSPMGVDSSEMSFFPRFIYFAIRRSITHGWYQPMLKIQSTNGRVRLVGLEMRITDATPPTYAAHFDAKLGDRLSLFVNDGLSLPPLNWLASLGGGFEIFGSPDAFYSNNGGTARAHIEPVTAVEQQPTRP